jgi:hypothetical protein
MIIWAMSEADERFPRWELKSNFQRVHSLITSQIYERTKHNVGKLRHDLWTLIHYNLLQSKSTIKSYQFQPNANKTAIWAFRWWSGEEEEHIAKSSHAWATSGTTSTSPARANRTTTHVCTCDNSSLANSLRYVFNCYFHHLLPSNSRRGERKKIKDLQKSRAKRNPINLLSILIENFFVFFSSDKQNGDHQRPRKHSTTESLYSRHERSKKHHKEEEKKDSLEGSWIYALCMRCRVQCKCLKSENIGKLSF